MTDFYVEKRDGEKVKYNPKKIEDAITKANDSLDSIKNGKITKTLIKTITNDVDKTVMSYFEKVKTERDTLLTKINKRLSQLEKINEEELTDDQKNERKQLFKDQKNISEKLIYINIENIQDIVENTLIKPEYKCVKIAKCYIKYRRDHERYRLRHSDLYKALLLKAKAENDEKANANLDENSFGGRIGEVASIIMCELAYDIMSERQLEAFLENEIYPHDRNAYFVGMHNCLSVPFDDIINDYGVDTRNTDIRVSNSANTAGQMFAVGGQLQSLQQFGGFSATHTDTTMVIPIRKTYYKNILKARDLLSKMNMRLPKLEMMSEPKDTPITNPVYWGKYRIFNKHRRIIAQEAMEWTEAEVNQVCEALYHNLNTLQSRSGNQLPFSSLNYGLNTSIEGRMMIKALLRASMEGLGKYHRTSIFPCGIFQLKDGVNSLPGDPNYDLKLMAIKSTVNRFYPNYFNCDWSVQVEGIKKDRELKRKVLSNLSLETKQKLIEIFKEHPEYAEKINLFVNEYGVLSVSDKVQPTEEGGTMGCLDGSEVITYKLNGNLYVESFEHFWKRVCTETPFEIKRQSDKNLNLYIDLENVQIYDSGKNEFVECKRIIRNVQNEWNKVYLSSGRVLDCTDDHPLPTERGRVYARDLIPNSDKLTIINRQYTEDKYKLKNNNIAWITKNYNRIPNMIFESDYTTRLNFLAGMIDNDGYCCIKNNCIELDSIDKELAIQQMLLSLSLGFKTHLYENNYDSKDASNNKYKVCIYPTKELIDVLQSSEMKEIGNTFIFENKIENEIESALVTKIEPYNKMKYSYDVTTESDHFDVSGIWSHNCRTYNGYDVNFDEKYFEQLLNEIISTGKLPKNYLYSAMQKDGRGNITPSTVIMPTYAMKARLMWDKDKSIDIVEEFMKMLDKAIDDTKDFLIERFEHICSQKPSSARFMYENDIMKGYIRNQGIRSALKHGTLAVGQLGLAETLQILIGKNHLTEEGMALAERIEQLFKAKCDKFKEEYKLNFGVYFTPAENLCYTAMTKFRNKYKDHPYIKKMIKEGTLREYFTNSIHVPVWEKIDIKTKIDVETRLSKYSSAGCILYIEFDGVSKNNLKAVEEYIDYAKRKDAPYIAINIPADVCLDCGFIGDFSDGEKCAKCGSSNILMPARITGYLNGDWRTSFNYGKQQEKKDREKQSLYTFNAIKTKSYSCGCDE